MDGGCRRRLPHSREHLVSSGLRMIGPDEIIHQHTRLRIMATLNALSEGRQVEFTRLRAILRITDGNLGAHLTTLENAGYIAVTKDFIGKKPRTRIALTRAGRKAFSRHIIFLREILDGEGSERESR
jgi:DNA-binding MarR family transcriptional regulator